MPSRQLANSYLNWSISRQRERLSTRKIILHLRDVEDVFYYKQVVRKRDGPWTTITTNKLFENARDHEQLLLQTSCSRTRWTIDTVYYKYIVREREYCYNHVVHHRVLFTIILFILFVNARTKTTYWTIDNGIGDVPNYLRLFKINKL